MKNLALAAATLGLAISPAALAAPAAKGSNTNVTRSANVIPAAQATKNNDRTEAENRANIRAILEVCTSETPAADRAAICDGYNDSPG